MTQNDKQGPVFDTQKERWLKYGTNVGLVSIIVILLALAVTWAAQSPKVSARIDTTSSGRHSLKPQTLNIIKDNTQQVRLISLYTRVKARSTDVVDEDTTDYVQPVEDLLTEYSRKGGKISVEFIDPNSQPTKVNDLISEVATRYGGEVAKYKAVVEEYPAIAEKLTALANAEVAKVKQFPELPIRDRELYNTLAMTVGTIQQLPKALEQTQEGINKGQKQKPPDYKGATDAIQQGMSLLSSLAGLTVENFTKFKDDVNVPEVLRTYMAGSLQNYETLRKTAEELDQRIKGLGELKLDELKRSLDQKDVILVLGENDMRVIPRDKVWREPQDMRMMQTDGKPKMRFAGEQMVTSAILAVTAKNKPKVAFIRAGGPPLTMLGIPGFMPGGPFGLIAERLRDYNFEVVDKDITGMWAMQAQMQGGFAPPEPSDEEIKDAIWVVVDIPQQQQRNPMMPQQQPSIAPKLAEHLKRGGSALVLTRFMGDGFAEALDEWGVKIRTDAIAVHQAVEGAASSSDFVEQAQRVPYIFLISDYGDHLLTRPLRSLDAALVPLSLVQTEKKDGFTATPILPVPQKLPAWGETNIEEALRNRKVAYDKDADIAAPIYGGAVLEKKEGGRVVVIGSGEFITDGMLMIPDPKLAEEQRILVPRFPGNAELFMNSVFYLAKMEPMIAISPAAMEVNRIGDMSTATLNFWRVGIFLIGLPGLVVIGGVFMYLSRRD